MHREPFKVDGTVSIDRLRDLRRRYRAEEIDLFQALDRARDDLDRWVCVQRTLVADGASIRTVRKLCDAMHQGVDAMERDLVEIRSAVQGLDQEIDELMRSGQHRVAPSLALWGRPHIQELQMTLIPDSH